MSVTPSLVDLTLKQGQRIDSSSGRSTVRWLLLSVLTIASVIAVPAAFDGWMTAIGLSLVGFVSLVSAVAIAVDPGKAPETVVLVGRNAIASIVGSSLDGSSGRTSNHVRVLRAATTADAASLVAMNACDEVIFTEPGNAELNLVDKRGRRPAILSGPEAVERLLGRVPMELAEVDRWLNAMGPVRALAPSYVRAKRALDFSIALGLAVATLPVMLIAAIVIRLDSPGPVIFRQERRGLGGKPFEMIKFRSMRIAEQRAESTGDWEAEVWTQKADPRITRAGRFLRASRIDELPQLWNVLRGDMTFVGPRPEPLNSAAVLEEAIPAYPKRYAVLPGLTGWAQVCHGYTNSVDGQRRKVEYDLYYVKHASLGLDLRIMARTAMVILRLKGL